MAYIVLSGLLGLQSLIQNVLDPHVFFPPTALQH